MIFPKILIFTPIYEAKDYCLDAFIENCKKFKYPNYKHIIIDNSKTSDYFDNVLSKKKDTNIEFYRVERGNNSRESLARSQNFARQIAIDEDYSYAISLESDIFPPEDFIYRLLRHAKPVVSGFYYLGTEDIKIPCITLPKWCEELGAWGTRLLGLDEFNEYTNNGLKKVQAAGMGCCLISVDIFKKGIAYTYDPRFTGHSDIYFFNKLFEMKQPVYVDTDLYCEHDNSDWANVSDR